MTVFQSFLAQLKAFWAKFSHFPIVEPVLELLSLQRVLVLIAGAVAFFLIPTIPNLSAEWSDKLGQLVFYGSLGLFGGIQVDQWIDTRNSLPKSLNDIKNELLNILLKKATGGEIG